MRRAALAAGIAAAATGGIGLASATALRAGAPLIDSNQMFFDGADAVTFSMDHYVITSGQKWAGVSNTGNCIDIRAGRKNSAPVAAAFIDGLAPAVQMLATTEIIDTAPQDLNFAVFGNVTFRFGQASVTLQDFRLGQGHEVFTNNWWLASSNCGGVPLSGTIECGMPGQQRIQFHVEKKSDRIIVSPA